MKKFVSMMLIAALMLTVLVGCGKSGETTPATGEPAGPDSALELLNTVWGLYGEDEKFPATGGEMGETLTEGPGAFTTIDEMVTYSLLIPTDQLENVTEIASLSHMMNSNTFTGGAYRLAEGVTAEDFGKAMESAVLGNQWMCGFPDQLLIQSVGSGYVVVAFGHEEIMEVFKTHLLEAYPDSVTLTEEPIM